MKELSLNILDIAENSVKAKASLTQIVITEDDEKLILCIIDDGCGMDQEVLLNVTNPFYTTRTTRSVGLGLPFLKLAAEQTGGSMEIESSTKEDHGTRVCATFFKNHIDFTPLGDVTSSIVTLIQGHPETDFRFSHSIGEQNICLDTRELREVLGDVPLNSYEVIKWIEEYLSEQYNAIK